MDDTFEHAIRYLTSLSVNGTAIMLHPRKTFVLGFAMCIKSAQLLVTKLLEENCNIWKYLLLYKVSQDNLEIFFSCIRVRGGNNNNPNVDQFRWALRKLLFCKSLCIGNTNCTNFNTTQYSIFEFRSNQRCFSNAIDDDNNNDDNSVLSNDVELETVMSQIDLPYLSEISENILIYIAGYVIRKLMRVTYDVL